MYFWIFISTSFICLHFFKSITDYECQFFISEPHVFSWDKTCQEDIDSLSNSKRHGNYSISCWFSIKTAYKIRKIVQNRQIVLDNYNEVLMSLNSSDKMRTFYSLSNIKIRCRLIKDIDIDFLNHDY